MNNAYTATVRQLLDIAPVVFATPHFALKAILYSPIGAIGRFGLEIRLSHPVAPEEGGRLSWPPQQELVQASSSTPTCAAIRCRSASMRSSRASMAANPESDAAAFAGNGAGPPRRRSSSSGFLRLL